MNKVIANETDYQEALLKLEDLMDRRPAPGTPESEEMELLALLVRDYESRKYHFDAPDPIDAINFRMEQQNLTPRDLVPYIGSRSKVSEILSRKRPLTLSMIRALHSGLGIPASALIQENEECEKLTVDWDRFPIKQMIAWGWVTAPELTRPEDMLRPFFGAAGFGELQTVLCRSSSHVRSARPMDDYALTAWSARVLIKASQRAAHDYKQGSVTPEFLSGVARLSANDKGPLRARDFLGEHGIRLVVERHLPGTYLDGAALKVKDGSPVIGLTLRYDRLDNFWFTLMHELAHLALHLDDEGDMFYDDLDVETGPDPHEVEADSLAGKTLVPEELWKTSAASRVPTTLAAERLPRRASAGMSQVLGEILTAQAAVQLARQLQVHPAIVAGRMRHEFKTYRLLNQVVGHHKVRKLFPEVKWEWE
ncbi:MAG: ImmA/IrrE family metallo-endopeptidase [Chloroflexi bacterium]|nr:ImmA/IrrE family metallo-endopeptidase [Chloroflexota bacterium]